MCNVSTRLAMTLLLGLAATTALAEDNADPVPAKIPFGENQWLRVLFWNQIWVRGSAMNPGTTILGEEEEFAADVALRRSRVLLIGQITPRLHSVTHFGVNNQSFLSARRPQIYIHEATLDYDVVPNKLSIGAGLHYWNGPTRMANASTITFLAIDSPIFTWSTIDQTDQFARRLGVYAKGKLGRFDYRASLDRPFSPEAALLPDGPVGFRQDANTFSTGGYLMVQAADSEPNTVPYLNGTWLGAKKVLNVGAGWTWHPNALGRVDVDGELIEDFDYFTAAADVFADIPVGEGAFTGYAVYQHMDFGPDYLRNVGILNIGAGGTSLSGAGDSAPIIGTGEHLYAQAGYLLPSFGQSRWPKLQPYAAAHLAFLDAFDGTPTLLPQVGANLYLAGQDAKLTLDLRARPIVEAAGSSFEVTSYKPDVTLQVASSF